MDVRSQLVDKAETRFNGITTQNGFFVDIGPRVFCWRKAPMDPSSVPGLIFKDEDALLPQGAEDAVPIGMWEHHLKMTVDVFFKGNVSSSQARKALADVVRIVFPEGDKVGTWDGLAVRTDLIGHAINTAQEGDVICAAHLALIIVYQTPLGTL